MSKEKTLRQQLRKAANEKLLAIGKSAFTGVGLALEEHETNIDAAELMRFLSGTQVATLQDKLITELANEAEAELLNIWNNQQSLDLEKKDAK